MPTREAAAPSLTPNGAPLALDSKTPREATAPSQTPSREASAPGHVPSREATAPTSPTTREALAPGPILRSEGALYCMPVDPSVAQDLTRLQVFEGAGHPGSAASEGAHPLHQPRHAPKPTYHIFYGDPHYQDFKRRRGLHGHINVFAAAPELDSQFSSPTLPSVFQHRSPVFSTFHDLPYIPTQTTLQSYLAMNNKEDTLTQSQMLKAPDSAVFVRVQASEIRGLESMKVFQYEKMSDLPPRARLLSSIWSYRRKRRPHGE